MTPADSKLLAEIAKRVAVVATGRPVSLIVAEDGVTDEVRAVADAVNGLIDNFALLRDFSTALANGRIDFDVPPKRHLLDSLKSLQSNLKHLTWQTQEIAAGNLNHHVDFLGDFSAAFNHMVLSLREKRQAEQELMQVARLASVGQLAAGIAHEINTPVQYIGDNLQYIEQGVLNLLTLAEAGHRLAAQAAGVKPATQFDETETAVHLPELRAELPLAIRESLEGVAQISRIVRSMKEFSHPGTTHTTLTDLNRALESTLTVSHNAWKYSAEMVCDFDPQLPSLICHAGEINQVFLNLILNAAQSIESSGKPLPGRIAISTRKDQEWIEIRVQDSGDGVPEALRQQIFEPFFTTKPVGKGTGQGLAICRDVIERKHGGKIEVEGAEGAGATFIVRLPLTQAGASATRPTQQY